MLEFRAMTTAIAESVLVPAGTVATAKGDGQAIDVSGASTRVFLATLTITKIIEQESLDVSIFSSADGAAWDAKSIAAFPTGVLHRRILPCSSISGEHSNVKFVRAHWEVARWGRGTETPMFEFGVTLKEVPSDIVKELKSA